MKTTSDIVEVQSHGDKGETPVVSPFFVFYEDFPASGVVVPLLSGNVLISRIDKLVNFLPIR